MTKHLLMAALGLATSLPALACTTCDGQSPASTAAAAAPESTVATADALTVVRDAETGELRAPTAAELGAMARRQASQQLRAPRPTDGPATPLLRRLPGGVLNVRLTTEFATYSVVARQPDGSIALRCVDGAGAAATAAKASIAPAAKAAELQ